MSRQRRWKTPMVWIAVIGMVVLSACSTAPDSTGGGGGNGTTTITWATTGSDTLLAAEREIIAAFEKEYPDIHVEVEAINFADFDTKMTTSLRAGQGADVFRVNHPNVQAWTNAGYLADLGGVLDEQQFSTDDFIPGLLDIGKVNNGQYTLPIDTDCRAFWYNPKLLKEAGIVDADGEAKPPETWDELIDAVSKFKGPDTYGYVYRTDSDYAMAYEAVGPYLKTAGGKVLSEDGGQAVASGDANTVAAVELLQTIAGTKSVPPGEANMSEETSNKLFASGRVAMMTAGPWARDAILQSDPDLKLGEDFAVTTIPTPEAGQESASASGGWQVGLNAESSEADAAAQFLTYFEQPDNLVKLATSNSFPPLNDGLSGEPYSNDPFYEPFTTMLPNSGLPITPVAQLAQVAAEFESSTRKAVNEGADVKEQLSAFDKLVNEQVLQ